MGVLASVKQLRKCAPDIVIWVLQRGVKAEDMGDGVCPRKAPGGSLLSYNGRIGRKNLGEAQKAIEKIPKRTRLLKTNWLILYCSQTLYSPETVETIPVPNSHCGSNKHPTFLKSFRELVSTGNSGHCHTFFLFISNNNSLHHNQALTLQGFSTQSRSFGLS